MPSQKGLGKFPPKRNCASFPAQGVQEMGTPDRRWHPDGSIRVGSKELRLTEGIHCLRRASVPMGGRYHRAQGSEQSDPLRMINLNLPRGSSYAPYHVSTQPGTDSDGATSHNWQSVIVSSTLLAIVCAWTRTAGMNWRRKRSWCLWYSEFTLWPFCLPWHT